MNWFDDLKATKTTPGKGAVVYVPDVESSMDYYAFGAPMTSRSFSSSKYRYGFNGKENDPEVRGVGNALEFGDRSIYDAMVGRFISIDPRWREFPDMSPYAFAANNPIFFIDEDGAGAEPPTATRIVKTTPQITSAKDYEIMEKLVAEANNLIKPPPPPSTPIFLRLHPVLRTISTLTDLLVPSSSDIIKGFYRQYTRYWEDYKKSKDSWLGSYDLEQVKSAYKMLGTVTIQNSDGDMDILNADPSTLSDFYLNGVLSRINQGKARYSDARYAREALSRRAKTLVNWNQPGVCEQFSNEFYKTFARGIKGIPDAEISIYKIEMAKGSYIGTNTQMYSDGAGAYHYYVKVLIDGKTYIWDNYNNGTPIEEYTKSLYGFDRSTNKEYSGQYLMDNSKKIK